MGLLWGRPTGVSLWNGMPHRQPTILRRVLCVMRHRRHMRKFGAYPRGSCVWCHWWPDLPK